MNNNDRAPIIKPRRCPYCGRDNYHGTMQAHLAAWHASKAQRMVPQR
jgi:hypothetical protein